MPDKTFELEILTPNRKVYAGKVTSLIAPGAYGYLGVWSSHAPMVAALKPGRVTYRDTSGNTTILESKGSGLLEVSQTLATLLADEVV